MGVMVRIVGYGHVVPGRRKVLRAYFPGARVQKRRPACQNLEGYKDK